MATRDVPDLGAARLVRHGSTGGGPCPEGDQDVILVSELAPLALEYLARIPVEWSEATLLDPLYLRQPAIHRT